MQRDVGVLAGTDWNRNVKLGNAGWWGQWYVHLVALTRGAKVACSPCLLATLYMVSRV